jgi:hypothetical protein
MYFCPIDPRVLSEMMEKNNMSKAPEHFKPFNREQAISGAPFGCKNGNKATVILWADDVLIGYVEAANGPHSMDWKNNGDARRDEWHRGCDLVMLPVDMLDDKPLFVGDKIMVKDYEKEDHPWVPATVGPKTTQGAAKLYGWRWTSEEPEYPKTRMSPDDLYEIHRAQDAWKPRTAFLAVANAAIARAIQDGDVVPVAMLEKMEKEVEKAYTQTRTVSGGVGGVVKMGRDQHGGTVWAAAGGCGGNPTYRVDIADIIKRVKAGEV